MAGSTVKPELHAEASAALEAVRASGLTIADAAKRFAALTDGLEWALWATDPAVVHERFNYRYADEEFATRWEQWQKARDDLRLALEGSCETFNFRADERGKR